MALLTPEEKKQIEAHIAAAENRTSGEIVVSVVHASGDYAWIHWAGAVLGWAAASMMLLVDYYRAGWGLSTLTIVGWQAFGAAAGSLATLWPALARRLVTRRRLAAHVHHECLAHFTALGMHETDERTGILVFISEFERRVQILADTGIHEQAGNEYWREQIETIVAGIRQKRSAAAIMAAVDRMADKLAAHYPPRPGRESQLSNQVRDDSQIKD